ncbi:MAG: SEL1-like repeat protein [Parachlamydiaceae bacterium]|nr:SEL1-like repeat protein [Parachlamydiaceae bacterium]
MNSLKSVEIFIDRARDPNEFARQMSGLERLLELPSQYVQVDFRGILTQGLENIRNNTGGRRLYIIKKIEAPGCLMRLLTWLFSRIFKSKNWRIATVSDLILKCFECNLLPTENGPAPFEYEGTLINRLKERWAKKPQLLQRFDKLIEVVRKKQAQEASKRSVQLMEAASVVLSKPIERNGQMSREKYAAHNPFDFTIQCLPNASDEPEQKEQKAQERRSEQVETKERFAGILGLDGEDVVEQAASGPEVRSHKLILCKVPYFFKNFAFNKSTSVVKCEISYPQALVDVYVRHLYSECIDFTVLQMNDILLLWGLSIFLGDDSVAERCREALLTVFATEGAERGKKTALLAAAAYTMKHPQYVPEMVKAFIFETITLYNLNRECSEYEKDTLAKMITQYDILPVMHVLVRVCKKFHIGSVMSEEDFRKKYKEDLLAAAERGDTFAQYSVGSQYSNGDGVFEEDHQEAFTRLQLVGNPDKRHTLAMFALGACFDFGKGTPKDEKRAFELFKKAGAQKHGLACYNASATYWYKWLNKNRDDSDDDSDNDYLKPDNRTLAMIWAQDGAALGDPDAQHLLGKIIESNPPGEESRSDNISAALKWYHLAVDGGVKEAQEAIDRILQERSSRT